MKSSPGWNEDLIAPFVVRRLATVGDRFIMLGDLHGSAHSLARNLMRLVDQGYLDRWACVSLFWSPGFCTCMCVYWVQIRPMCASMVVCVHVYVLVQIVTVGDRERGGRRGLDSENFEECAAE